MKTLKQALRPLRRLYDHIQNQRPKQSFSQSGEDLIVKFIFYVLGIENPSYLDIGAYDAKHYSNTYLLYRSGSSGVCIEPDRDLWRNFKNKRPRDRCLNVGIGIDDKSAENFYVMNPRTLNTFSKEDAESAAAMGKNIIEIISVPLLSINNILAENFPERAPNFVSLDIEGLDFEVIKTLDFERFRPEVFCIETLTYSENRTGRKLVEIIDLMRSKDYFVYGDTYINTIFVDIKVWSAR